MSLHIHPATLHNLTIFVAGCSGSLALEIMGVHSLYLNPKFEFPERYRQVGFTL